VSISIPVCTTCGCAVFPPVLLCPRCGGRGWALEPVESGLLEGRTERDGTAIGAVRTSLGPVVVVRIEDGAAAGATVALDTADRVPVARLAGAAA
jgi:hypothetical protein